MPSTDAAPGLTIELRPQNPLDLRPEDLTDLVTALRAELPDAEVSIVANYPTGDGVTFWEVLDVWLTNPDTIDKGLDVLLGVLIKTFVDWARKRFKTEPGRPKYGAIHGPDGRIIKSVRLDDAVSEPVDQTDEDRALGQ